ncbi:Heat shock protein DnaJ N-terminal [Penicillium malachiteum]|uniref:Heat shock protein DnaJ N-terminal n=1 Tax=Penicillium malachiteum TaxID=1324776 RepID=UPI002546AC32|nr:Heat shock protein DnaJ N-terminal [Penicillium malachiteum]KAJ5725215.1 Heat shock protein DnaJ N-terminal [Penicillium malachiteum]
MVKADVRRDYYADLGLSPSAESEDVKKQFRKLALKFHPDRNPGREQEFIAKFQAIQAAHEILSDPQHRLKYDTDRLRAGYGKVYGPGKSSAPRRPPPAQARPTPPKPQPTRPSYPSWNAPGTTPHQPSAGAQRYSSHARAGAGSQQWQKKQDESQTRADAYKSFSGMRGSTGPTWQSFDPQTGRSGSGSTPGGIPRQQNTPFGKSAYESTRAQQSATPNSGKKKQGYAPGNAAGDEPPARNTSAYTHNRSERPHTMYFEPAPSPTARKPKPPPAPEPPTFTEEFERNRRGYASTGGEKTFFSSSNLGRQSSSRMSSSGFRSSNASRTNPPSPEYPSSDGRHHSASPKPRRPKGHSFSSAHSTSSSDLDDSDEIPETRHRPTQPGPKPKAVPKSRLRPNQQFADFHRTGDASPGTGEEPNSTRQSSYQRSQPTAPTPLSRGTRRPRMDSPHPFVDLTADRDENKGHNSDSAAFRRGSTRPEQPSQHQGSATRYRLPSFFDFLGRALFSTDSNSNFSPEPTQDTSSRSSTAFGHRDPSKLNTIHKKFSAEDWRNLGSFDFGPSSNGQSTRSSKPPSPLNPESASAESMPSAGASGVKQNGDVPPGDQPQKQAFTPFPQAKFNADIWAKELNNLDWKAPEQDKARQSANTPPSRSPRKQSRAGAGAKAWTTPQPASVASEAEEANETVNVSDMEAMDIDEEIPLPSMPDQPAAEESQEKKPSQPDSPVQPAQTENNASNVEPGAPLFDLDNILKTAPFTTTNNGGIENLDDVHATLPFESRAKKQTTTERDIRPRDLNLPNPPKRPKAPKRIQMGLYREVLPEDKWKHYLSHMASYIHEWNSFNRRMLLHFNTRQEAMQTGLHPNWMSGVGDSSRLKIDGDDEGENHDPNSSDADEYLIPQSRKGGFSAYLRGIEEDIQVRKHWDVACEMHRECIMELGRLREWIRGGGQLVAFSTV